MKRQLHHTRHTATRETWRDGTETMSINAKECGGFGLSPYGSHSLDVPKVDNWNAIGQRLPVPKRRKRRRS